MNKRRHSHVRQLTRWPKSRRPVGPAEPLKENPLGGDPLPPDRLAALGSIVYADTRLAEELLALPPKQRKAKVLRDPRFHRQNLATLFALRAEDALEAPAAEAVEAAALALTLAVCVPPDARGKAKRTLAFAFWLTGKALLRKGDQENSEQAFTSIVSWLLPTGLSELNGLRLVGLAQLRWHQERPAEAVTLFNEAATIFSQLRHAEGTAASLAQAGFVLLGQGEHSRAKGPLCAAYRAIEERHAPSLAILICLALARCDTSLGHDTRARASLERARLLVEVASRPAGVILGKWWEALVAHLVGPPSTQTDTQVARVRRRLLRQGPESEAIRITFHQVLLRIAADRCDSVPSLTGALTAALPAGAEPWAQEIAALGRLAAEPAPAFRDAAADLALRLALEAFQRPGLPGLAPGLCTLADQLVGRRGEIMKLLGSPTGR